MAMNIKNVAALHAAIVAVAPIDGVSGDGTIWFQPGANQGQKTAAQNILNGFTDTPLTGPAALAPPMAPLPKPKGITEL